jgi:nucleotide-binding universal stress UspA family protein
VAGDDVPRIFVGVHGSVGSLHALRCAVDEARRRDGIVHSVIAWTPPGGEMLDRRSPEPHLRRIWMAGAGRRLRAAWDEALGGVPADVPVHLAVVRGPAGRVLTGLADRDDDLLVLGAGRGGSVRWTPRGAVPRFCVRRAVCRVLVVPLPALARGLDHGVLPSLRRRRAMHDLLNDG